LLGALGAAALLRAAPVDENFFGRWALTTPNGHTGWFEIKPERGWFDGSLLWEGGSVLPVASVAIADGTLTVTRLHDLPWKNAAGTVVRTQQLTDVITAHLEGDTLKLAIVAPRPDGRGADRGEFAGRRIPALPPRPDLAKARFGEPIVRLNGCDLADWRLVEPDAVNGWSLEEGALVTRPVQTEGQPRKHYGNLRTDREFEDFNLRLEVRVHAGSNSGVYLRGLCEVQVLDSFGKPLDSHNMGAIYSRLAPAVAAEKPAGEWQSFDITLLDRHATVVLNGTTIIDNQSLQGCTGGALWSDELRSGPIYLQGRSRCRRLSQSRSPFDPEVTIINRMTRKSP